MHEPHILSLSVFCTFFLTQPYPFLHTFLPFNVHFYCSADEHLAELMPIFDEIRARGEVGNAYPLHVGSTAGPTLHMAHVNPNTCYWVIHSFIILFSFLCSFTPRGVVCLNT